MKVLVLVIDVALAYTAVPLLRRRRGRRRRRRSVEPRVRALWWFWL